MLSRGRFMVSLVVQNNAVRSLPSTPNQIEMPFHEKTINVVSSIPSSTNQLKMLSLPSNDLVMQECEFVEIMEYDIESIPPNMCIIRNVEFDILNTKGTKDCTLKCSSVSEKCKKINN